jgi:hypothetical protein
MEGNKMIEVENLSKRYGEKLAVDGAAGDTDEACEQRRTSPARSCPGLWRSP